MGPASEVPSVRELRHFLNVRVGHNHQLQRLAGCLEERSLPFNNPEVASMISAVFWQLLPAVTNESPIKNCCSSFARESTCILGDPDFANRFLDLTFDLLDGSKKNWDEHVVLYCAVVIGRAIFNEVDEKVS